MRPPFCVCLLDYYFFEDFFADFLAAFFVAILPILPIDLTSMPQRAALQLTKV